MPFVKDSFRAFIPHYQRIDDFAHFSSEYGYLCDPF